MLAKILPSLKIDRTAMPTPTRPLDSGMMTRQQPLLPGNEMKAYRTPLDKTESSDAFLHDPVNTRLIQVANTRPSMPAPSCLQIPWLPSSAPVPGKTSVPAPVLRAP